MIGGARNQEHETGVLSPTDWGPWKRGLLAATAVGVLLFAVAALMGLDVNGAAQAWYGAVAMASPQAPLLAERARCLLFALTRTGFFLALSSLAAWWVLHVGAKPEAQGRRWWKGLPWAALLVVLAFDLGTNAKRYVVFFPWRQVLEENPLANFLGQDKELFRVKVIGTQQHPQLNNLVSNILPYKGIPVVDPPAASRIPNDYSALFKFIDGHYVRSDRYFDFFNVKYVLSPAPFSDPSTPFAPIAQWNGINVYRRENFLPRAWLAPSARVVREGEEEILKATLHPLTDLRATVILEEAPKMVPEFPVPGVAFPKAGEEAKLRKGAETRNPVQHGAAMKPETPSAQPSVRVTRYEGNRVEMETEATRPSILVLNDKWDPDWKAWVDGRPERIMKANFLMRGVELAPGKHLVKMEYRPSTLPFRVSAACVLLFAGYGLWAGLRALRRKG